MKVFENLRWNVVCVGGGFVGVCFVVGFFFDFFWWGWFVVVRGGFCLLGWFFIFLRFDLSMCDTSYCFLKVHDSLLSSQLQVRYNHLAMTENITKGGCPLFCLPERHLEYTR